MGELPSICVDVGRTGDIADTSRSPSFNYFELASLASGASPSTVELALYDLSKGVAKWVPAALLGGRRFEGVWHSGLRAFGKEYWFGGMIIEADPDATPFGKP